MDNAVALVQAYLRINGYFTVSEYPVVEGRRSGEYREATDIDILGFRFPGAGRLVPARHGGAAHGTWIRTTDSALGLEPGVADMLIGEVKEGRAQLNRGSRRPAVLGAALSRFGCCEPEHADDIAEELIQHGFARAPDGHRIRLVAFGTSTDGRDGAERVILLSQVVEYIEAYLQEHWALLRHAQIKEPGLGFLTLLRKAQGEEGQDKPGRHR